MCHCVVEWVDFIWHQTISIPKSAQQIAKNYKDHIKLRLGYLFHSKVFITLIFVQLLYYYHVRQD